MSNTNFINAARQAGRLAGVEARSQAELAGNAELLQIGKVSAVHPDGAAAVDIIDDDNNVIATHDYAVPVPHAALTVGGLVWIVQNTGAQVPYILVSGGGSGCSRNIFEWGVMLD